MRLEEVEISVSGCRCLAPRWSDLRLAVKDGHEMVVCSTDNDFDSCMKYWEALRGKKSLEGWKTR